MVIKLIYYKKVSYIFFQETQFSVAPMKIQSLL